MPASISARQRATSSSCPLSVRVDARTRRLARTRVETDSRVTATEFLVTHAVGGYGGDERIYARTGTLRVAPDGV